jgi:hypothetical protein
VAGAGVVDAPFSGDAGTVDAPFCGSPGAVEVPLGVGAVGMLDVRSNIVVSVELVPPQADSAVLSRPTVASGTSRSPKPRQPPIRGGT